MPDKTMNVNAKAIAKELSEKFKDAVKNGTNLQDIPNVIMDVLKTNGIELPDKVKEAIQKIQQKS